MATWGLNAVRFRDFVSSHHGLRRVHGSWGQDRLVPLQIQLCSSFEQICLLVVPKGNTLSSWRYSIIPPPKPSFIVMPSCGHSSGVFFLVLTQSMHYMDFAFLQIPQNDHRVASSPPSPATPTIPTVCSASRDMPHHSHRACNRGGRLREPRFHVGDFLSRFPNVFRKKYRKVPCVLVSCKNSCEIVFCM